MLTQESERITFFHISAPVPVVFAVWNSQTCILCDKKDHKEQQHHYIGYKYKEVTRGDHFLSFSFYSH